MIVPDSSEPRLPMADPVAGPFPTQEAFRAIRLINLFRTMPNAETLYRAYMNHIGLLFKPVELSSALERMVVLHIARESHCFFAWRQNVPLAKSVKVTQEQIDALEIGDLSAKCFSTAQKAAFRFTDKCMQLVDVADHFDEQSKACFSDRAITEMMYVIATHMLIVSLLRAGRAPLDEKTSDAPSNYFG